MLTIVSLAHAHCVHPERITIGLETTGLDARRHNVVSIAPGVPGHVAILDLRLYDALAVEEQACRRETRCQVLHYGGPTWIGQKLTCGWQFLAAHFGSHLETVCDTMLVEQVLYGVKQEHGRAGFNLRDIAARYGLSVSKEELSWFVSLDERPAQWAAPFPEKQLRSMVQDLEVPSYIAGMQQPLSYHCAC